MFSLRAPHHGITSEIKANLAMWLEFLQSYNGVSCLQEELCIEAELQVHLDAVQLPSFGIYFRGYWCVEECGGVAQSMKSKRVDLEPNLSGIISDSNFPPTHTQFI